MKKQNFVKYGSIAFWALTALFFIFFLFCLPTLFMEMYGMWGPGEPDFYHDIASVYYDLIRNKSILRAFDDFMMYKIHENYMLCAIAVNAVNKIFGLILYRKKWWYYLLLVVSVFNSFVLYYCWFLRYSADWMA